MSTGLKKIKDTAVGLLERVTPLNLFITCSVIFGSLFILLIPPFKGADEATHFQRAYQISEGNFVVDSMNGGAGGYLPTSIEDTISYTTSPPKINPVTGNGTYDIHKTTRTASFELEPQKKHFYDFSATATYSPVPYVPSASAILVTRILRLPPILSLFAARIANLAVWIALMAAAIYVMPRKKWAVAGIGLLPTALFQGSMVGADPVLIGSAALFIAMTFKLFEQKDQMTKKQMVTYLAIAATMTLTKQVMFILLPLALLIPAKRFTSQKFNYAFKAVVMAIPVILLGYWQLVVTKLQLAISHANMQDPAAQVHYILRSPQSFLNAVWNTHFYTWGDSITQSFIGTFGTTDTGIAAILIVLGYIGLAALLFINYGEKPKWFNGRQKLFMALIVLSYWLAVDAALYIYYSPVGFKIIVGLQGRYFLPVALLAIPLLYGSWLKASKAAYRNIAIFFPIFLLVVSVGTVYFKYYINSI